MIKNGKNLSNQQTDRQKLKQLDRLNTQIRTKSQKNLGVLTHKPTNGQTNSRTDRVEKLLYRYSKILTQGRKNFENLLTYMGVTC